VIRVLLADDNDIVRIGLVELFESSGDITVVAECADGDEVLARAAEAAPDVFVLDLAMPRKTGLEAAREVLAGDPGARVILLTGNPSPAAVREAKEIGLLGYVLKGEDPGELIEHVRRVARGGTAWSRSLSGNGTGGGETRSSDCSGSIYRERRHGLSAAAGH
jgi:DNA-binding NarL/FixJ family response regulator